MKDGKIYNIWYYVDGLNNNFKVIPKQKLFIGTKQEFKKLKNKLISWGYRFVEVESIEECTEDYSKVPF